MWIRLWKYRFISGIAGIVLVGLINVFINFNQRYDAPEKMTSEDRTKAGLPNFRPVPPLNVFITKGVNCAALIQGDSSELSRVKKMADSYTDDRKSKLMSFLYNPVASCANFITNRGYVTSSLGDEEKDFPIAFGILIYTDLDRFERLLRAIYRPQNFYCVHVDKKASDSFFRLVKILVTCFPNVFLSSHSVDVRWGTFSVLEADTICLKELLRFKWKYFINLTGQEFPLKTNKQLVKILKAYRGANDIRGTTHKFDPERVAGKGPPPFNISLMKGPMHIAASRGFAEFIFQDSKVQTFMMWLTDTHIPDETFYPTVNNNPHLGVPGGFRGPASVRESWRSVIRHKRWVGAPCSGLFLRDICIFNIGDLPDMAKSKALFANKFLSSYGQYAYDCIEELHWNRTIEEYLFGQDFNTSFYSALPHVMYRE